MKTLFKIFALVFGLTQFKQNVNTEITPEPMETEAYKNAEKRSSFIDESINESINRFYSNYEASLSTASFVKYKYHTQRVICL